MNSPGSSGPGRRIIPVSSGKGGVGKTTFALNYALSLSTHGPTVLLDLDTGTSSVRNCIDAPIERDLYHFFKQKRPLGDCVTSLPRSLDPDQRFKDFGFVAAPRHLIEDVTNFNQQRRDDLIDAINGLEARFVVLDLKAGLDANVVDFLPYSNSGILIFTPHLPAATLAAADLVKAVMFRKLRTIFAPGSPVYSDLGGMTSQVVNRLLDSVEDVYEEGLPNLDAFVDDLRHALGEQHEVLKQVSNTVSSFVVHYVLNLFDGVASSFDSAVKPFGESLAEDVSSQLTILNLGWVIAHPEINQASIDKVPVVLRKPSPASGRKHAAPRREAKSDVELERLAARYLGRGARKGSAKDSSGSEPKPSAAAGVTEAERKRGGPTDPSRYLTAQLESMLRMLEDQGGRGYLENFNYIVQRSLETMQSRPVGDFGDARLYKRHEIRELLQKRGR